METIEQQNNCGKLEVQQFFFIYFFFLNKNKLSTSTFYKQGQKSSIGAEKLLSLRIRYIRIYNTNIRRRKMGTLRKKDRPTESHRVPLLIIDR